MLLNRSNCSFGASCIRIYIHTFQPAEYAMFNYFNNSLWEQIGREHNDFWEELRHFREVNKQVSDFCHTVFTTLRQRKALDQPELQNEGKILIIQESKWNKISSGKLRIVC